MRIDPGQLLTFLAIHEAGGFNRASMVLHKSQPALTRTVRLLEDLLDAPVFTRSASGIQITAEGESLLKHARAVRDEIRKAELGLERIKAGKRIPLSIGIAPVYPLDIFAEAIADLVNEHPNLDVMLIVQSETELLTLLREGALGFAIMPIPLLQHIGELQIEPVFLEHASASIYCRPDHPITEIASPTVSDLGKATWILGAAGSVFRDRMDALFDAEGVQRPRVLLEVDDARARRNIILECDTLSIFSAHDVVDLVRDGQLVAVPFPLEHDDQPLVAVSASGNRPIMSTFAQHLRQRYRESTAGSIEP